MDYAYIKNGVIEKGPCRLPKTFKTNDGLWISGFNCLDDANLKTFDWFPAIKETLSEIQTHGEPVVGDDTVTYPAVAISESDMILLSKEARDSTVENNIVVHGVGWQVDSVSRDHMRNAIETATRNNMEEVEQGWILTDNSVRNTTVADLAAVLDAYTFRMGQIYGNYTNWLQGEKAAVFSYSG